MKISLLYGRQSMQVIDGAKTISIESGSLTLESVTVTVTVKWQFVRLCFFANLLILI